METCKACGGQVAKGVKKCPHCGKDQRSWPARHKILTALGALAVIIAVSVAGNGGGEGTTETATVSTVTDTATDTTDTAPDTGAADQAEAEAEAEPAESVPQEYQAALRKAQNYSDMMYMSKLGLYDQLTSEYGEQFSGDAAQYAVDNVDADWNYNALEKAKSYRDTMSMSKEAIRDQLTSEFGEQFTQDQADYAVSQLD